ncbi:PIN domain-containing protein [Desulfobacterota bacterium AH_259_B03_O07]|nr:PIN domain-containing protein [Desulfobacterota bacterium AH_259_B03_O07]
MTGRILLDTNVVVYLFDNDSPEKQIRAHEIFSREDLRGSLIISTQVLQEFYVCVTRKLAEPLEPSVAYKAVQELAVLPVVQVDTHLIFLAISRSQKDQVSFWDALIIEAALVGGAFCLYSEDLQHGRIVEDLRIENPFV